MSEQDEVARRLAREQWAEMARTLYGDPSRPSGLQPGPPTEAMRDRIALHATFEAAMKIQATLSEPHPPQTTPDPLPVQTRLDAIEGQLATLRSFIVALALVVIGVLALAIRYCAPRH